MGSRHKQLALPTFGVSCAFSTPIATTTGECARGAGGLCVYKSRWTCGGNRLSDPVSAANAQNVAWRTPAEPFPCTSFRHSSGAIVGRALCASSSLQQRSASALAELISTRSAIRGWMGTAAFASHYWSLGRASC
jgi:hypothetical protein